MPSLRRAIKVRFAEMVVIPLDPTLPRNRLTEIVDSSTVNGVD